MTFRQSAYQSLSLVRERSPSGVPSRLSLLWVCWLLITLLVTGNTEAGRLGFSVGTSTSGQGVEVTRVAQGSRSQQVGLQVGDQIISCNGRPVAQVEDFVSMVRQLSADEPLKLLVNRNGWQRSIDLNSLPIPSSARQEAATRHTNPLHNQPWSNSLPLHTVSAARSDGLRASAKVGYFTVKAAKASSLVGDGLRELMLSALYKSGYFLVSDSNHTVFPPEQVQSIQTNGQVAKTQVADILVYGIVSEFEPEAGGFGYSNFIPQAGLIVRQSSKFADIAIDIRAVDVSTGRVLVAERIPGSAQSFSGGIGGGVGLPIGLVAYRDTPMEMAIRDCIEKAAMYIANNIPEEYYSHD